MERFSPSPSFASRSQRVRFKFTLGTRAKERTVWQSKYPNRELKWKWFSRNEPAKTPRDVLAVRVRVN
jgi:hypothetical protein